MDVTGQLRPPSHTDPRESPRYPLDMGLGGPQCRCGRCLASTIQSVARHFTDRAIPAILLCIIPTKYVLITVTCLSKIYSPTGCQSPNLATLSLVTLKIVGN
jgi:hypothetical protein